MPVYEFRCSNCDKTQFVEQSINDKLVTPECCLHLMKRIYSAPPISFKGSGFYRTDK
jgi:putative FmdB family regulatory protein